MEYETYSDEFKRGVLEMAAEGKRSIAQIERELDITAGLIYKWQQWYRVQAGRLEPSEERAARAALPSYGSSAVNTPTGDAVNVRVGDAPHQGVGGGISDGACSPVGRGVGATVSIRASENVPSDK